MLKRLVGFLAYLLLAVIVVAAVASTTLAPSYRECAHANATQEIAGIPARILLFVECEAEFLRNNELTLITIAIIVIAFLALALQRSTVRLWKTGERQIGVAEKVAETARLSAQAAVLSERAHLFVSVKASNLDRPLERARLDDGPEPAAAVLVDAPRVDYILSNYGRTVALLREVKHALTWDSSDGLRSYQPGSNRPLEVIAPHTDSKIMSCRFRGDFTTRDARAIVTGKRALVFFGEAIFVDAFGHRRGVKWQCRCGGGDFDLIGYQEFEPDQEDREPAPD